MADTWYSDDPPPTMSWGAGGWWRIVRRGIPLFCLVFGGLIVLLLVRLVERPVYGVARPMTPHITRGVCRGVFVLLGMTLHREGEPLQGAGAVVANHSSWLDIFALNASKRIYFVSKSEVAAWPGIGWLARATGTVFIKRDRSELNAQIALFQSRLNAGHRLLFFPEGTSTDGLRVLAFKPALFAAFFDPALRDTLAIQPVTVSYVAPPGQDARFYGWWGGMDFGPHLLATLALKQQGTVRVIYHPAVKVADFQDRKKLALALEHQVRAGLTQHGTS